MGRTRPRFHRTEAGWLRRGQRQRLENAEVAESQYRSAGSLEEPGKYGRDRIGYAVTTLKLSAGQERIEAQSGSMVASGSSKMGIPFRIGYTRLHSLHFKLSSPRSTSGLRQLGQASISSNSGEIMTCRL